MFYSTWQASLSTIIKFGSVKVWKEKRLLLSPRKSMFWRPFSKRERECTLLALVFGGCCVLAS